MRVTSANLRLPEAAEPGGRSVRGETLRSLSVIVPAYDEERTIGVLLEKLLLLELPGLEVIVVDDGSTDDTARIAREIASADPRVRSVRHAENRGKGAAIRTALGHVRGEVVVVQDADLEYDPGDLPRMLRLFEDPGVQVVYGSRRLSPGNRALSLTHRLGGALLTWLTNRLFGSRITDEATCYKMVRADVLRGLELRSEGFEFCPEVTARLCLAGHRIHEVPISYTPRSVAEGKKIRFRDGVQAIVTLLRLRLSDMRVRTRSRQQARRSRGRAALRLPRSFTRGRARVP